MLVRTTLLVALSIAAPSGAEASDGPRRIAGQAMTAAPGGGMEAAGIGRKAARATNTGLIIAGETGRAAGDAAVDESALRYYAKQNDMERVETEIRRLRSLYPNWRPPENLYALLTETDEEQPLWQLFGDDRLAELRAEIARRRSEDPGWRPSDDLMGKLALKEARRRLVNASDAKQWATVVDIATTVPAVLAPDDVDALWRAAEAHARSKTPDRAFAIYRDILTRRDDAGERRATVQKAVFLLDDGKIDALIAMGRRNADGSGEFDGVGEDRLRARFAAVLSKQRPDDIGAAELQRFASIAGRDKSASDAALIGWYRFRRKEWAEAADWFERGLSWGSDPKTAEGAIRAHRHAGNGGDAKRLAITWHGKSDDLADLYLTIAAERISGPKPQELSGEDLSAMAAIVDSRRSAAGAEALGWYHYNAGRLQPAAEWFEKAFSWQESESRVVGLALSLNKGGDGKALAALTAAHKEAYPALGDIRKLAAGNGKGRGGPDPVVAAYQAKKFGRCLKLLDGRRKRRRLSHRDSLMQGWCLLGAERPREAAVAFGKAAAGTGKTRRDAIYGKSLAHLRVGETLNGENAARAAALTPKRRTEIDIEVLTQRAVAAFNSNDYRKVLWVLNQRKRLTREPRNLAMLRGWSLYHLGDGPAAHRVFKDLDTQLSTKASRQGVYVSRQKTSHFDRY